MSWYMVRSYYMCEAVFVWSQMYHSSTFCDQNVSLLLDLKTIKQFDHFNMINQWYKSITHKMWYSRDICAGDPKLHIPNSNCHRHALHKHSLQAALHVCITRYVTLSHLKSKNLQCYKFHIPLSTWHINKALYMYNQR